MGILTGALTLRRAETARPQSQWMTRWGGFSSAGPAVTEESALRYSAVWACVQVIMQDVGKLPWHLYRRVGEDEREKVYDHALYRLLMRPNPFMTSARFRRTMQRDVLLWGNAYAEIEPAGDGIGALWPLPASSMEKIEFDGETALYTYRLADGKTVILPGWRVFHLRGPFSQGMTGISPIAATARETVGKALAVQQYGSLFFRNGARPGGMLTFPGELSPEALARIRQSWSENYGGLTNAHRVAVLEQGMTYQEVGMPPADAAYIEDQKMTRLDIASIYRVPPHKIGDLERATFSNIVEQERAYVQDALMPYTTDWEQDIRLQLMSGREQEELYVRFSFDNLLRTETKERFEAYAIARQNGWMNADEIRGLEDMNPLPDGQGQQYLNPLNMAPAGDVADDGDAQRDTRYEIRDTRETRAVGKGRIALMRSQRAVFADVMGRVCRRQAQDIGAMARKLMGKRDTGTAALQMWLPEFYADHESWTIKAVMPLYLSYGRAVGALALQELDAELWDDEEWAEGYARQFAAWHVAKTQRKVEAALADEDGLTALEATIAIWLTEWPEYLAQKETVQAANSAAKSVYRQNGVMELVWETTWGDKSCHYCDSLDGTVVGIQGKFDIEGLPPFRSIEHPPAHDGCECVVVARPRTA